MDFKKLATQYKDELMNHILPFWLECSQDHEYGGYFTCLDRQGNVFDTDKFIWLQGREVWMFSMLYNKVEKRQEWLDCAIQGGEFLKKYGHDGNYNWYFSLDRQGNPLVEPYNANLSTNLRILSGKPPDKIRPWFAAARPHSRRHPSRSVEQSPFGGVTHGLHRVVGTEFLQNALPMRVDRMYADREFDSDLFAQPAPTYEPQNFALALR